MLYQYLSAILADSIKNLGVSEDDDFILLEHPSIEDYGEYSTNIAMILYPRLKDKYSSPRDLAQAIINELETLNPQPETLIEKIDIAGPGFINFHLKPQVLLKETFNILEKNQDFGKHVQDKPQNIYVEHTQPNTNKPNHIGHLRNSVLGMSLVHLLKNAGHHVVSTNINNDRGIANIKGMWAFLMHGSVVDQTLLDNPQNAQVIIKDWQKELDFWFKNQDLYKKPENFNLKPDHWVGKWYVIGHNAYEASEEVKQQMLSMLSAWENNHQQIRALWKLLNDWFYQGSWITLHKLGVSLDTQEYESDLYKKGKDIILAALDSKNPHFIKLEDGAIQANLENFKLPNKILIRKDGTTIYMTFDIELTRKRTREYHMDRGIWVVGSDQELHFQQLFQICELLGFGKKESWYHFSYGMVDLKSGKMSSRTGNVVTADDVIDLSLKKALEATTSTKVSKDITSEEVDDITNNVALAAVKYGMLSYKPQSKILYDPDTAVSFNGNSGPYIQYTHARCCSVLNKANLSTIYDLRSDNLNPDELALLRYLYRYEEVTKDAADTLSPHTICNYLYELCQRFNAFYAAHSILSGDNIQLRLVLTKATSIVLKNGLSLLGITAPEKM